MARVRRLLVGLPLVAVSVGCDQASKLWAVETLGHEGRTGYSWLGGAVRVLYAENPGAFLGLGGTLPDGLRLGLLVGFSSLLLVVIGAALWRARALSTTALLAGALLLAGGIGNLIDRVLRDGFVVDFLHLALGPIRTGIFNIADVQLMIGAVLLAWLGFSGGLGGSDRHPAPPERA